MTLRLHHQIKTDEAVQMLVRLDKRGQDMTDVFAEIGERLLESTDDRFRAEVDPDGNPWALLSAATLARKKGRNILNESGRLKNRSLRARPERDHVEIGTNLIYARIHQLGGQAGRKRKRVTIPERPFLGVSASDQVLIDGIMRDALRDTVEGR